MTLCKCLSMRWWPAPDGMEQNYKSSDDQICHCQNLKTEVSLKHGRINLFHHSFPGGPYVVACAHSHCGVSYALPADASRALEPVSKHTAPLVSTSHPGHPSCLAQLNLIQPVLLGVPHVLVRASDSQQVSPVVGHNVSDGGTCHTLPFLGIDILHALELHTQDTQPSSS